MPVAIPAARLIRTNLGALTLASFPALEFPENLLLLVLHALGFVGLSRYFQLPGSFILVLILALVILLLGLAHLRISATWLAPFFFVYLVLIWRFVLIRFLGGRVGGYFDYELPEWTLPFLHVEAATVAAGVFSAVCLTASVLHSRRRALILFTTLLLAGTYIWASARYFGQRTHGVTGSDPYAYVQMGVDLATRGTFTHRFELFPGLAPLQFAWYPLMHVGYRLPMNLAGDAVTVWPPGGSVAYAIAYLVGGEETLYWVNPLFTLFCVLAAGALAWELTPFVHAQARALIAVVTCALLATASVQMVWAGVAMVDSQAEFFSILALYFALRARTRSSCWYALLPGLALGLAYDVRHTQLVLGFSLLIVLWGTGSRRWQALFLSGLGAFLVALPDMWYHQLYLGSWFHPESEELALYSLNAVGDSVKRLYKEVFAASEFGWFVPFLVYGLVKFAQRVRVEFWALAAWVGLSLGLHLPYAALRSRDLLPEFPAFAFFAAFGAIALLQQLGGSRHRWIQAAGALVLWAALDLFVLRGWNTIPQAWQPAPPIFGLVTKSQRAAFDELSSLLPDRAVVGSTLNDGAIDLYVHRNTFRPDGWNEAERREFVRLMLANHASVYVLEDSGAMTVVLDGLRREFSVERVATLEVPLFGEGPVAEPGALWKLSD